MADVKISELTALTSPDGAEELVVNDAGTTKKITITNATSASLPLAGGTMTGDTAHGDNVKAKFGAGNDLQLYHDGSNSFINDTAGTGNLYITSNQLIVNNAAHNENMARFAEDGAVTLYNNGSAKIATTATGVDVTGTVTANTSGDSNSSKGLVINTTGTNFESDAGIIQVTHAGGGATTGGYFMKMKAGGGDKFTIKGNGDVVAAGTVTADGVYLGGTGAANKLDDYEEGTWTPTGSSFTVATIYSAKYTKIGQQVTVVAYINASSGTGSPATIGGLPFTSTSGGYSFAGVNITAANPLMYNLQLRVGTSSTDMVFQQNNDNSVAGTSVDSGHIIFTATYFTDS